MDFKSFIQEYLKLNPEKESVICTNNADYTYIYLGDILNKSTFDKFEYTLRDVYLVIPNSLDKSKFTMFREKVDIKECDNYDEFLYGTSAENFIPNFSGFVHHSSSYHSFCYSPYVVSAIDELKYELQENVKEIEFLCDLFDILMEQFYNYFSVSSHDNHQSGVGKDYKRGAFTNNNENDLKVYVKHYNILNGIKIPTVLTKVTTSRVLKSLSQEILSEIKDVTEFKRFKPIHFKGKELRTMLIEQKGNYIITNEKINFPVEIKQLKNDLKNEEIDRITSDCNNKPNGTLRNLINQLADKFGGVDGDCVI